MILKKIAHFQDFYIDHNASLKEAISKMNLNGNGSVVLLKGNRPTAILTQSNIINAIEKSMDLNIKAYSIATTSVITINESRPIDSAFSFFTKHSIRRLVLVNDAEEFSGIVLQESLFKGKCQESEYLMMQQFKLTTMSEMIRHLAHQWKQPLAQLGGVFMNLESAYAFNKLNQNYLEDKVKNGTELIEHISTTIDDFRNFFMPKDSKEVFEVSEYIKSVTHILQATLVYHHIELEIIEPEQPAYIDGFPNEFAQVILNLLNNAKDTFLEREISSPKIVIETKHEASQIIVTLKDNAGGIDNAIIDKVFDIYFTTKDKESGTGLGLYISKLIIENKLMGNISVSNDGDGIIFTIYLNKIESI